MNTIKLGSRDSKLAVIQTEMVMQRMPIPWENL